MIRSTQRSTTRRFLPPRPSTKSKEGATMMAVVPRPFWRSLNQETVKPQKPGRNPRSPGRILRPLLVHDAAGSLLHGRRHLDPGDHPRADRSGHGLFPGPRGAIAFGNFPSSARRHSHRPTIRLRLLACTDRPVHIDRHAVGSCIRLFTLDGYQMPDPATSTHGPYRGTCPPDRHPDRLLSAGRCSQA